MLLPCQLIVVVPLVGPRPSGEAPQVVGGGRVLALQLEARVQVRAIEVSALDRPHARRRAAQAVRHQCMHARLEQVSSRGERDCGGQPIVGALGAQERGAGLVAQDAVARLEVADDRGAVTGALGVRCRYGAIERRAARAAHLLLVPNKDIDADQPEDAPERWQDTIKNLIRDIRARRLPARRVEHSVRREEEDLGALCRVAQPTRLLPRHDDKGDPLAGLCLVVRVDLLTVASDLGARGSALLRLVRAQAHL